MSTNALKREKKTGEIRGLAYEYVSGTDRQLTCRSIVPLFLRQTLDEIVIFVVKTGEVICIEENAVDIGKTFDGGAAADIGHCRANHINGDVCSCCTL